MPRPIFALLAVALFLGGRCGVDARESFVGNFAEPADGGNLDTAHSSYDGTTVVIVPRAHPSEAIGGATRWRNLLFAIRGMNGKAPVFRLPLTSPGNGRAILSDDPMSLRSLKLVWSYEANATKWNTFDTYTRRGSDASDGTIEARNAAPFREDIVYVSINEHYPVSDFYAWLRADVFPHPFVAPTASQTVAGTFVIGYQSGAPASGACSRPIPAMPLYAFIIRDPAAHPAKLVILVSGQHPYEGQNKAALRAAVDWILHSRSAEAQAYRDEYVTLVYPFVNPTGELAGLWRGTAYAPSRDTNRNWQTTETDPARDRGIDTVIVHKNAMSRDIAAIGLGAPYAAFDYHQNCDDRPGFPDYVLHAGETIATAVAGQRGDGPVNYARYFARISMLAHIADMPSGIPAEGTLRSYLESRGVTLSLTFERSVYHSIVSESAFGAATVRALVSTGEPPTPEESAVAVNQSGREARNVNSAAAVKNTLAVSTPGS